MVIMPAPSTGSASTHPPRCMLIIALYWYNELYTALRVLCNVLVLQLFCLCLWHLWWNWCYIYSIIWNMLNIQYAFLLITICWGRIVCLTTVWYIGWSTLEKRGICTLKSSEKNLISRPSLEQMFDYWKSQSLQSTHALSCKNTWEMQFKIVRYKFIRKFTNTIYH